jgi:hypothetical protein
MKNEKKLNKLTEEQELIILIIATKWIDKLNKPQHFDEEKAIKAVEWLYEFSKLAKPKVLICASPLDCQNQIASVGASALDSVRASVGIPCTYGDVSDYDWTAFYDFFKEINHLQKNENFEKWLEYCDANIYYCIQCSAHCAICPMPMFVKRDSQNRMHCEDGKAIKWADGWGIYVLNGIRFDRKNQEELYWKIVRKELTLPEILRIEDIDQRAIALKYCNPKKIIEDLGSNAILLDEATKLASYLKHGSVEFDGEYAVVKDNEIINTTLSYKLYKISIPDVFDTDEYMLVYPHASIPELSYWKGVEPEVGKLGAIEAIASSHNMTLDEYLSATSQS